MKTRTCFVAAGAALCCNLGWAQSSVQIYGLMDLGVAYANHVRSGAAGSRTGNMLRLDSGNAQSSRLGFRGREDLGGGLTALFVLEEGINADVGTPGQGGRAFGRASYVGLAGKLGQIVLGRETTVVYDFGIMFDPVAPAKFAGPLDDSAWIGRADNAVKYAGRFGPVKVSAQYSLGYDSFIANGGELDDSRVGRQTGVYADYTTGNFTVGATFDRQNGTSVAAREDRNEHVALGAIYDFKAFKLYATFVRRHLEIGGKSTLTRGGWVGARFPLGPVNISTALYAWDPEGAANRSLMAAVFASYPLSKRTDIYSEVAYRRNQSAATLGLIGATNPGEDPTGFTFGIRHRF